MLLIGRMVGQNGVLLTRRIDSISLIALYSCMRSTFVLFVVIISFFVFGCSTEKFVIDPIAYLDSAEQNSVKYKVIRYAGDLPGKGSHDNKFDSSFNDHYLKVSAAHQLRFYYEDAKTEYSFFLLTRIAPSLSEKYVAIGGKLKLSADSLVFYEEVFRTWKMPENDQLKTAEMLFRKMLKGEDLRQYYPENSGNDYIIEFPSSRVYFDTSKRRWLLEELRGKQLPNMVR